MKTKTAVKLLIATSIGAFATLAQPSLARADGASSFPEPAPTVEPSTATNYDTRKNPGDGEYGRDPKRLALAFGGEAGLAYYTEGGPPGTAKGIGRALTPGAHLGLRASFEIFSWLAIEGRGVLTNNEGNDLVSSGSLTTVGGFGAARFTLPMWRIKPYALLGFGGYSINASGASTQLVSSGVSAYEVGVGALIPMSRHVDIGVEYLYTQLNGEVLSTNSNADGGDPNSFSLFAQYRFEL